LAGAPRRRRQCRVRRGPKDSRESKGRRPLTKIGTAIKTGTEIKAGQATLHHAPQESTLLPVQMENRSALETSGLSVRRSNAGHNFGNLLTANAAGGDLRTITELEAIVDLFDSGKHFKNPLYS